MIDRKVNRIIKYSKIKNVFYVLENDYEIGLKEKSSRINHVQTITNYGQYQKRADRRTTPMADLFEESI